MLCTGGWSSTRSGAAANSSPSRTLRTRSAVSVTKLHSSIPVREGDARPVCGIPGPKRANRCEPRENGCAANDSPSNTKVWSARAGVTSSPTSSSTEPCQPSSTAPARVLWSVSITTSTPARCPADTICATVPVPSDHVEWRCTTHARSCSSGAAMPDILICMAHPNSFGAKASLDAGGATHEIFRLDALQEKYDVARLPYSIKILLENLLRFEDGESVTAEDVENVARWAAGDEPSKEIAYTPARVLMQDFTGVPAVVDLAAMRDAMEEMGGDASRINPLRPAELVIDHSIQVDECATKFAFRKNAELEFHRNRERYEFLRWGQEAFDDFAVVPPNTGICHQVNLEYLARVVYTRDGQAFPDTLVGTDSHTTMINGLGVLGWGVGGIEAEAAMLGQPISMLLPQVVGFRLTGELPEGATATDLVLTVTEMLREKGVVSKFVEFFGPGIAGLGLADRATIGNMSPEFGSTCAIFPIDAETLRYLEFTGRPTEQIELVDAYTREQGLFHEPDSEEPTYSDTLELDLGDVVPSIAGPKRPQDRIALTNAKPAFLEAMQEGDPEAGEELGNMLDVAIDESFPASDPPAEDHDGENGKPRKVVTAVAPKEKTSDAIAVELEDGQIVELDHGMVVIAAITSCTNTSNPSVMLGAGLIAKKAVERGLRRMPWVKTSLAPGSTVVTEYLEKSGLDRYLNELQFNLVGYGCTTCIGNSGPLPEAISKAVNDNDLVVCSVLSGNRNFEGRI